MARSRPGSKLVKQAGIVATDAGARSLWCDARTSALSFYEKLGMQTEGSSFMRKGVKYVKMRQALVWVDVGAPTSHRVLCPYISPGFVPIFSYTTLLDDPMYWNLGPTLCFIPLTANQKKSTWYAGLPANKSTTTGVPGSWLTPHQLTSCSFWVVSHLKVRASSFA